jgi:hypothetical protein
MPTPYISSSAQKKISLAEATWQAFSPYLSHYQWAFDDPGHSPRKVEIAGAILNRGKDGCCTFWRPEGYKYVLPVLHPRHFEDAVANRRKVYYVSYGRQALLYSDIDLHHDWQKRGDGERAMQLLGKLMPQQFWANSARGGNGYLKVGLRGEGYGAANNLFDRLQDDLRLYLAWHGNVADFEVKGKVGFLKDGEYQWAQYGKLPIHCPDWNFARLEEFKAKPTVTLRDLTFLCNTIEAAIPREVLERHEAYKKSLGDRPWFEGDYFLVTPAVEKAIVERHGECWRYMYECSEDRDGNVWIHRECYRPGEVPLTGREWREARQQQRQKEKHERDSAQADCVADGDWRTLRPCTREQAASGPGVAQSGAEARQDDQRDVQVIRPVAYQRGPVNLDFADLTHEPDSFRRQKEALFRYARYLKRSPTDEEGLRLIEGQELFSAPWEQRQAKRGARVRDILSFISRTFDAGKCAHGSVNVGKYDEWAAEKFPRGLTGRTHSGLDETGHKVDGQAVHVSPGFIGVFLAVCEFALLTDKNQDGSLPHRRAQELWEALYAKGLVSVPFCARKWAVCREAMVRHGVVAITDRDYHHGKAMRWAVGPYFPFLGLWKGRKLPSLLGPGCFTRRMRRREQGHNTLLRQQPPRAGLEPLSMAARPPP